MSSQKPVQLRTTIDPYNGDIFIQNQYGAEQIRMIKQPDGTYNIYASSGEFAQRITGIHGLQSLIELPGKILREEVRKMPIEIYRQKNTIGIFDPVRSEGAVIFQGEDGNIKVIDGRISMALDFLSKIEAQQGLASLKDKNENKRR